MSEIKEQDAIEQLLQLELRREARRRAALVVFLVAVPHFLFSLFALFPQPPTGLWGLISAILLFPVMLTLKYVPQAELLFPFLLITNSMLWGVMLLLVVNVLKRYGVIEFPDWTLRAVLAVGVMLAMALLFSSHTRNPRVAAAKVVYTEIYQSMSGEPLRPDKYGKYWQQQGMDDIRLAANGSLEFRATFPFWARYYLIPVANGSGYLGWECVTPNSMLFHLLDSDCVYNPDYNPDEPVLADLTANLEVAFEKNMADASGLGFDELGRLLEFASSLSGPKVREVTRVKIISRADPPEAGIDNTSLALKRAAYVQSILAERGVARSKINTQVLEAGKDGALGCVGIASQEERRSCLGSYRRIEIRAEYRGAM